MAHVTSSSTMVLVSGEAEGVEAPEDEASLSEEETGLGDLFLLAGDEEAEDIPEVEAVTELSRLASLVLPHRGALRVLGRWEGLGRGGSSGFTFM